MNSVRWNGYTNMMSMDGSTVLIDGMVAKSEPYETNNVLFATSKDFDGLIENYSNRGYNVRLKGSPGKGIKEAFLTKGMEGFALIDSTKAWMTDEDPDIAVSEIHSFERELKKKMKVSAGRVAGDLVRLRWMQEDLLPIMSQAYTGGIQWTRPGTYLNTVTIDMNEAYLNAMLGPMPDIWRNEAVRPSEINKYEYYRNTVVKVDIEVDNSFDLPLLPHKIGGHLSYPLGITLIEGAIFHGADIMSAIESNIAKIRKVHAIIRHNGGFELRNRIIESGIRDMSKPLRKRLSLALYGVNAQKEVVYEAAIVPGLHEAIVAFGIKDHTGLSSLRKGKDIGDLQVWWVKRKKEKPYVRMDIGGAVTADVRNKLMNMYNIKSYNGQEICRLYVDSITYRRYDKEDVVAPDGWKVESEGPISVIGPPGICLINGDLKHSGTSPSYAVSILEEIRRGNQLQAKDISWRHWTGLYEDPDI